MQTRISCDNDITTHPNKFGTFSLQPQPFSATATGGGKVSKVSPNDDSGDHEITIETFDDLAKVRNVYAVENLDKIDIQKAQEINDAITE